MPMRYLDSQWTKGYEVNHQGKKINNDFILIDENGNRTQRKYDYIENISNNLQVISFRKAGVRYNGVIETFADEETGFPVIRNPIMQNRVSYK
jgi:hypothetical protein